MQPNESTVDTADTTTFTLSTPLVIAKGGSSTVKIYGDYKAGIGSSSDTHTFDIGAVGDIVAIGATTGTTLTASMKGTTPTGSGQAMTYGASGSLATVLDTAGRPNSANIAVGLYGQTGVTMTKLKIGDSSTNTEDVDVDYVDLTRTSGGTGVYADIATAYLYEGTTLLATGVKTTTNVWRFDFTNYTVPAYRDAFDLAATTDLVATGKASGITINGSAIVNTQPDMYLYRSIPTLRVIQPASTTLVASTDREIIRIGVKADAAGDIEFTNAQADFIRFTMGGSAVDNDTTSTTDNFVFKSVTDNNAILDTVTTDVSQLVNGAAGTGDGATYMVKCTFATNALTISAGEEKIITMEADLGDFEAGTVSNYITATVANTSSDFTWSDLNTDANANNTFFTWLPLVGPTLSN